MHENNTAYTHNNSAQMVQKQCIIRGPNSPKHNNDRSCMHASRQAGTLWNNDTYHATQPWNHCTCHHMSNTPWNTADSVITVTYIPKKKKLRATKKLTWLKLPMLENPKFAPCPARSFIYLFIYLFIFIKTSLTGSENEESHQNEFYGLSIQRLKRNMVAIVAVSPQIALILLWQNIHFF